MTKSDEYTKMMKDMFGSTQMDTSALQNAFKSQAAMMERMTKVALEAAEKSTEVSAQWTKATLAKAGDVASSKKDPADYSKAMSNFTSAQAELASEHAAAFAEIAKKLQLDTVGILLATGKNMQEETTVTVKSASETVTNAVNTTAAKSTDTK